MLLNTLKMACINLMVFLFLTVGFVVCECADSVFVETAAELIKLFRDAKGNTLQTDIEVTADLDFSASTLTFPLGVSDDGGTCVSFSGVFQGNGHSIKGLEMDNTYKTGYKGAGLFCSLKNATVENIVIDSSCYFSGYGDGVSALSVSVNGSLSLKNVTNKAVVSGYYRVGSFIGQIEKMEETAIISFENCVNDAKVTGSGNCVGGFVGLIWSNPNNVTITVSNSTNNGIATGKWYVGGLIGYILGNTNITVTISNSTNNGKVIGSKQFLGGLIGVVSSDNSHSATVNIINCANKGSVSTDEIMACGFVCVDPQNNNKVKTTVINSINKGRVSTNNYGEQFSFGITNIITKARNVVSMGTILNYRGSYTFWNVSTDVRKFYGMNGDCVRCNDDAILFRFNDKTKLYEVTKGLNRVDDLLNYESEKRGYGMLWSRKLDLVHVKEEDPTQSSQLSQLSQLSLAVIQQLSPLAFIVALSTLFIAL